MKSRLPIRLVCLTAALVALSAVPARAGFEEGEAAFARKDWRAALDEWLPLAEAGDARAQHGLGTLYYAVQHNYADGVYWLQKAAEQGEVNAQTRLGLILMHGKRRHGRIVVTEDRPAAIEWLRKAAGQGFAAGEYYLGVAYANGWGVERDDIEAVGWFRKAAEQGFALAEYKLGEAYLNGTGAPIIPVVAVEWITRAAEQNAPYAQFALGRLYEIGNGVARDAAVAAAWYRRASELDHAEASYRLGLLYAAGRGVDADHAEAYRLIYGVVWHLPTQELNMQARRTLDALEPRLTPAQRAEIQRPEIERLKRQLSRTAVRHYR